MKYKRTFISILLITNIIIPVSLLFASNNAAASFLSESEDILTGTETDFSEVSMDINKDGVIYYTATRLVKEENDTEIVLKDSTAETDTEYTEISEGEGELNTTDNEKSKIVLDNGIAHIVWRGVANDGGDYDIFYTNNSGDPNTNIVQVTNSTADEDNPDIEVVNGTVFIAYDNSTDVLMKSTLGSGSIGTSGSPTQVSQSGGTNPKLSLWTNYTGVANTTIDWKLDLGYIDEDDDIIYKNITKGKP
ncbi:MAG: hypothetical protein ACOC4M_17375 [Promethearchaeia archaeon]